MSMSIRIKSRIAAAVAIGCTGLGLASTAGAVDLRDWGKKYIASERFIVLAQFNNEAVLDKETQLVWERSPSATLYDYGSAAHIGCGRRPIGGRFGWRLPSETEFMTLLDPAASNPVKLPAGHPFTIAYSTQFFWTSTRYANPAIEKWIAVNVAYGYTETRTYSSAIHFWCVRGSQQ